MTDKSRADGDEYDNFYELESEGAPAGAASDKGPPDTPHSYTYSYESDVDEPNEPDRLDYPRFRDAGLDARVPCAKNRST